MQELKIHEKEMLVGLSASPAYQLLLSIVGAEIDEVERKMEGASSQEAALWQFHLWRAMRKVHAVLKTAPENYEAELKPLLDERREQMGGYFADARIQETFPFS